MPDLSRIGNQFMRKMRLTTGQHLEGQITFPGGNNITSENWMFPQRILRVAPTVRLPLGAVLDDLTGRRYLIGDNGETSTNQPIARSYRLVEVTHYMAWKRIEKTVDPLTQQEIGSLAPTIGSIPVALEPLSPKTDELQVPKPRYRMVTGTAVALGDRMEDPTIGKEYTVKEIYRLLGLFITTVE